MGVANLGAPDFRRILAYNYYAVHESRYPFRLLGHMNRVEGASMAEVFKAARKRFREPAPVLSMKEPHE